MNCFFSFSFKESFKDLRAKSGRSKHTVFNFPAHLMPGPCVPPCKRLRLRMDATGLFQRDAFTGTGPKTAVSAYFQRALTVTEVNDFKACGLCLDFVNGTYLCEN